MVGGTKELGVACATPHCAGGGRTTPGTPRGSTMRRSRGGATIPDALCDWPTTLGLGFHFFIFFFLKKKMKENKK
jgi:hypothetical protein